MAWWDKEITAIKKQLRKRAEHVSGLQYHKEIADSSRSFGGAMSSWMYDELNLDPNH